MPWRKAALSTWAAVLAAALIGAGRVARADTLTTITIPDRAGEVPSQWLSYPGPPRANVLLPDGYDPRKRYPLLVLLNGLNTNYGWYAAAGLTAELEGLGAIVVMPEGGSGWYADWWNGGKRGTPQWESYELNEVLPAILARYPIRPQRRYHALAGTSMGGLGAAYLGGRLPGFFGSVASLSGFDDPQLLAPLTQTAMGLLAGAPIKGGSILVPVEGSPRGFYADGHNPTRLAVNLEQTRVFVTTGTGMPSKVASFNTPGSEEELAIIHPMSYRYDEALRAAGVDVSYEAQPGGHDIPDFANEIRAMLAWGPFKPVVTKPRSWVNDTVATSGQLWDVGYRFDAPPNRVVEFRRQGTSLSIGAAGSPVTITVAGGCAIHTATPATVSVKRCRIGPRSSARRHAE